MLRLGALIPLASLPMDRGRLAPAQFKGWTRP